MDAIRMPLDVWRALSREKKPARIFSYDADKPMGWLFIGARTKMDLPDRHTLTIRNGDTQRTSIAHRLGVVRVDGLEYTAYEVWRFDSQAG